MRSRPFAPQRGDPGHGGIAREPRADIRRVQLDWKVRHGAGKGGSGTHVPAQSTALSVPGNSRCWRGIAGPGYNAPVTEPART
ncbi:MAG: hypothetical protein NVSMB18_14140 [Acetobacteraceae bacterium]